ncbi:MAG: hypothetical protein H7Z12_09665, partial [Rhodospirillaceae bacterium]|nr:hypothetical protein [Rhodospirillales bacterium]
VVTSQVAQPAAAVAMAAEPVRATTVAQPALSLGSAALAAKPVTMAEPDLLDQPEARTETRMAETRMAEPRIERPEPAMPREPAFRPEPQMRAEPQLRAEPTMARPAQREQPAMSDLHRAVADIAEAGPQPLPQAPQARQAQPEPEARRGLFDRFLRPAPVRQPVQEQQPQQQQAAAPAPQPSQPRMATRGEPTVSRASEDLDIPAFLRRQAN